MKIALVNPSGPLSTEAFPHLGLGYLAAIARQDGHEVKIFDLRVGNVRQKEGFLQEDFEVVGITATSYTYTKAIGVAKSVKRNNAQTKVILGGPQVTLFPEETFVNSPFDIGVVGEGELTFRELLSAFEGKRGESFRSIAGLVYVENGKTIRTPPRPLIEDLDQLPLPDFTSLKRENYTHYPLLTSRGCPFQCVYCNCGVLWGKNWRARSPENIVREIRSAQTLYGWKDRPFVIVDDTFNLVPERVEALCDQLIRERLKISYYVWGFRADRAPQRMLEKMKESGAVSVSLGIESANPGVLKLIRKGESIDQITHTIAKLKSVDIYPMCLFMIGNPGDTLETVKETIRYVKKNHLYLVTFNMALPYPKTELWNYVAKHGTFLHRDYTKFHHYSKVPIFETEDFTARERTYAFRLSCRVEKQQRLKFEIERKIRFIHRGEYRSFSWAKLRAAVQRMIKYFLDLVLERTPKEKF